MKLSVQIIQKIMYDRKYDIKVMTSHSGLKFAKNTKSILKDTSLILFGTLQEFALHIADSGTGECSSLLDKPVRLMDGDQSSPNSNTMTESVI